MPNISKLPNTRAILYAATLFVLQPSPAHAVDAASLNEFKDSAEFKTYILGVSQGWLWANARLGLKKQPLLFCAPPTLALEYANYLNLLEGKIKTARALGTLNERMPVEVLLLQALEESFPCKP